MPKPHHIMSPAAPEEMIGLECDVKAHQPLEARVFDLVFARAIPLS